MGMARAAAKLNDIGIFKDATEVFGMLLDDSFALQRFLGGERSSFYKHISHYKAVITVYGASVNFEVANGKFVLVNVTI